MGPPIHLSIRLLAATLFLVPAYASSDVCQPCHEDLYNAFQRNPHRGIAQECESCHGPAARHAESASAADIRNPAKMKPADAGRVCLACHLNQTTEAGRIHGGHARNQVSCLACHSIHQHGPEGN